MTKHIPENVSELEAVYNTFEYMDSKGFVKIGKKTPYRKRRILNMHKQAAGYHVPWLL